MKKPLLVLVNPAAGRFSYRSSLGTILEIFSRGGWLPTVFFTEGPKHATQIARQEASQYQRLVCLGGDGTLSEVISGLMLLPKADRPALGYIPMGTANDMASTLRLSREPTEAARRFLNGTPRPIDIGAMGEESYFTYVAAFGAFTEVSYETDQETKHALGQLAYVLEGLTRLPRLSSYKTRVEYDDGVIEEDLIFGAVTNSTSVAGLLRLNEALVELSDGRFEVILIRNPRSPGDLNRIVAGLLNHDYSGSAVTVLHSRRVCFCFEKPVAWTRDGEAGGLHSKLLLENRFQAVEIIV
jgi:YegS/Rv2252/BmrU family lipid kinase